MPTVDDFMSSVNDAVKNADYSDDPAKSGVPKREDVEAALALYHQLPTKPDMRAARDALGNAMRNELLKSDKGLGVMRARVMADVNLAINNPSLWRSRAMGDMRPRYARSVAAHINEWIDSVPVGTEATVSQIAQFRSREYGTDMPSPGAIAARIWPPRGKAPFSRLKPIEDQPRRVRVVSEDEADEVAKVYLRREQAKWTSHATVELGNMRSHAGEHWPAVRKAIEQFLLDDSTKGPL